MINQILSQIGISKKDQNYIFSKMTPIKFDKGQILEDPNFIGNTQNRHIYFIKQGILRCYYYANDLENNIYFAAENQFISSYSDIITTANSLQYIGAITEGVAMRLSAKDYRAAYGVINGWEKLGRIMAEDNYLCITERLMNFPHLSARQKYQKFFDDFGVGVVDRIPDFHIASYLGVTAESLSRIKRAKS